MDGDLLLAIGAPDSTGSITPYLAQKISSPYGKVLRFTKEELINPNYFSKNKFRIYTLGHRNPQGIINIEGKIYLIEHGPKGGDEINLLLEGKNYGWPLYSLGSTYAGIPYPTTGLNSDFQKPNYAFIPSAAISDIIHCPENLAKRYSPYKCTLISSLRGKSIYVALIDNDEGRIVSVEQVKVEMRIREFARGNRQDENIYFSTDGYGIFQLIISNVASSKNPVPETWQLILDLPPACEVGKETPCAAGFDN